MSLKEKENEKPKVIPVWGISCHKVHRQQMPRGVMMPNPSVHPRI